MKKNILITGGAGFIGTNLAEYLLKEGNYVVVVDNLSRLGSDKNLIYLKSKTNANKKLTFIKGDIRNFQQVKEIVRKVNVIFHLAGQVAVTKSILNPREDFENNVVGTLNILEAARELAEKPIIVFSSTNKVYGEMNNLKIKEGKNRYDFLNSPKGVNENCLTDCFSPYGCSKGSAEQYVRDYYRIYGIPAVVFRQSCIYGPRQMGVEDQGWVAHFIISGIFDKKVTIYGNGKQVRDILYIDDLIKLYLKAVLNINKTAGQIYNVGGGVENSLSLIELIDLLEKKYNIKLNVKFDEWRIADQKIFISDNSKIQRDLKWKPQINIDLGIQYLINWIKENKNIFI